MPILIVILLIVFAFTELSPWVVAPCFIAISIVGDYIRSPERNIQLVQMGAGAVSTYIITVAVLAFALTLACYGVVFLFK